MAEKEEDIMDISLQVRYNNTEPGGFLSGTKCQRAASEGSILWRRDE